MSHATERTHRTPRGRAQRLVSFLAAIGSVCAAALAWDAPGHRTITFLALDGLAPDSPAFLRDENTRRMIASQSCEPDRWRAGSVPALTHVNNPDHYIDLEDLAPAGLSLGTLPEFRYEYVVTMAHAKDSEPARNNDRKDAARVYMTPGTLPYAILENYGKLQAAFKTYRTLEALNDPARAAEVAQCRAHIISVMGVLSHFVGDAAQPLHTTRHHHGWVGDNPGEYTTRYSFHAEIDGGILEYHALRYDTLRPAARFDGSLDEADPMASVKIYLGRSFKEVEPLYALDKEGDLLKDKGKSLITERLTDAAAMLSAMYNAAWRTAEPTDNDIRNFVKFDKLDAEVPRP